MSVTKIYSDQSRRIDWNVREDTDATLTLTVTLSAAAYDLSTYTFIAEFFKVGSSTAFLTLTQGSGITNGGATGIVTIALTDTQLNLDPNEYFWKLRTTAPTDNLWFNGKFVVNGYLWDGSTDSSANVALTIGGDNLAVALTIASVGSATGDVVGPSSSVDNEVVLFNSTTGKLIKSSGKVLTTVGGNLFSLANPSAVKLIRLNADNTATAIDPNESIGIACSDETTVLAAASTSVPVATFHAPYALTLTRVFAGLRTAGTGAAVVTVDIHINGTTIMSATKILFTASQKLSANGTLTTTALAAGDYVEIFLDQRDTDNVATGLKTYLLGYKA